MTIGLNSKHRHMVKEWKARTYSVEGGSVNFTVSGVFLVTVGPVM